MTTTRKNAEVISVADTEMITIVIDEEDRARARLLRKDTHGHRIGHEVGLRGSKGTEKVAPLAIQNTLEVVHHLIIDVVHLNIIAITPEAQNVAQDQDFPLQDVGMIVRTEKRD